MVYIKSWTRYQSEVEQLYAAFPTQTRYNIKFRAVDGTLVLKVTNDVMCLKHKATSAIILNRFESLNRSLLNKMANLQPVAPPPSARTADGSSSIPAAGAGGGGVEAMAVDEPSAPAVAGAGGKKKKGKGGKKK